MEAIRKAAYAQGYSDGERAGADLAAQQLQPVMQSFRKTTEELAAYKPTLRAEAEQELRNICNSRAAGRWPASRESA
jgi:flagellar biosynthesis/type III secretory pathway protein FliH